MNYRTEKIYVSTDVIHALHLLIKICPPRLDDQGFPRILTADLMADEMLRAVIREKHPELPEHQKAVEKMERELIKTLGGKA